MIAGAKYGHTNLIAKDWRSLARFYQEQFGCIPVPPERRFKGTLTTATGSNVTWVYVTDPEGNVIELQSWSR